MQCVCFRNQTNEGPFTLRESETFLSYLPPETKLGQGYIFTGVYDSVHWRGGGLPQCMLGYHTPSKETPPGKETPQQGDHPQQGRPPLAMRPPLARQTPPARTPPLRSACWEIRSTSGRYASYWNAILVAVSVNATLNLRRTLLLPMPLSHSQSVMRAMLEKVRGTDKALVRLPITQPILLTCAMIIVPMSVYTFGNVLQKSMICACTTCLGALTCTCTSISLLLHEKLIVTLHLPFQ